jgi:hypothetical protein
MASRHPRLSGIGRPNKLNSNPESFRDGQAGMTELGYLIAGLIVALITLPDTGVADLFSDQRISFLNSFNDFFSISSCRLLP